MPVHSRHGHVLTGYPEPPEDVVRASFCIPRYLTKEKMERHWPLSDYSSCLQNFLPTVI